MPQFDIGSFSHQIFFFLIFFINSYFLTTYFFLPLFCKSLKFRKKKIISLQTYRDAAHLETLQQQDLVNVRLTQVVTGFQQTFHHNHNQVLQQVQPLKGNLFVSMGFKAPYLLFQTKSFVYPKYFN